MIAYMHFKLGKGRATVALDVPPKDDSCHVVRCGLALCAPGDQFSRKRGRQIAEGRLGVGKVFCLVTVKKGEFPKKQVLLRVLSLLAQEVPHVPCWAYDGAVELMNRRSS